MKKIEEGKFYKSERNNSCWMCAKQQTRTFLINPYDNTVVRWDDNYDDFIIATDEDLANEYKRLCQSALRDNY